jgi:hypothetical protein
VGINNAISDDNPLGWKHREEIAINIAWRKKEFG